MGFGSFSPAQVKPPSTSVDSGNNTPGITFIRVKFQPMGMKPLKRTLLLPHLSFMTCWFSLLSVIPAGKIAIANLSGIHTSEKEMLPVIQKGTVLLGSVFLT